MLTDLSNGMLSEAESNLADISKAFQFQIADAQSIQFDNESFDAVIALHMPYHIPKLDKALGEICRVLRYEGKLYASALGRDNMRELQDLVNRFIPEIDYGQSELLDSFGLENGRDKLERFFADVELRKYEDSLAIPEVQPVVDYVLSLDNRKSIQDSGGLANLIQALEDEIGREGFIHIRKDVGLFISRKSG